MQKKIWQNPDWNSELGRNACKERRTGRAPAEDNRRKKSADSGMPYLFQTPESDEPETVPRTFEKVQWKNAGEKRKDRRNRPDGYFVQTGHSLKK